MSQNKMLRKERVLTIGSGSRRVVLCYDSGLAYSYSDPSRVFGVFVPSKGWFTLRQPHYSSGGWGRGGHGDAEGHFLVQNTRYMIRSIGGTIYDIGLNDFLVQKEIQKLNKAILSHNKTLAKNKKAFESLKIHDKTVEKQDTLKRLEPKLVYSGKTPKGIDVFKVMDGYGPALKVFLEGKGKSKKVDEYLFETNRVLYVPSINAEERGKTVVAFRDAEGKIFLNSQLLNTTQFEREFLGGQSLVQKELRAVASYSIPFNVLASAGLNLAKTKIIEQGPEGTYEIKKQSYGRETVERHFTGALLLENSGRKFLMDIDRREIEHQIFNAFFVEVDKKASSIKEAYDSMVPEVVKEAIKKGIEVQRQGEWFFIDSGKTLTVNEEDIKSWIPRENDSNFGKPMLTRVSISHGKGRPNTLLKPLNYGDLDAFVCGEVEHSGREHAPLDLGTVKKDISEDGSQRLENPNFTYRLWTVVGNTTVSNFTIQGDID